MWIVSEASICSMYRLSSNALLVSFACLKSYLLFTCRFHFLENHFRGMFLFNYFAPLQWPRAPESWLAGNSWEDLSVTDSVKDSYSISWIRGRKAAQKAATNSQTGVCKAYNYINLILILNFVTNCWALIFVILCCNVTLLLVLSGLFYIKHHKYFGWTQYGKCLVVAVCMLLCQHHPLSHFCNFVWSTWREPGRFFTGHRSQVKVALTNK